MPSLRSAGPLGVVLDFDGVVVESVDIKTRAFERLFEREGTEPARRIVAYHVGNGGISRFEKFRWAYRTVLRRPLPPEEAARLCDRFNALVEEAVAACEWVRGAREFIEGAHASVPLFMASGTPEEELRRLAARRGLTSFFKGIYGSPTGKAEIIRGICAGLGEKPEDIFMVGDSINDLDAAVAAGCPFIGRVRPGDRSPFPEGTRVLPDLLGLAEALWK